MSSACHRRCWRRRCCCLILLLVATPSPVHVRADATTDGCQTDRDCSYNGQCDTSSDDNSNNKGEQYGRRRGRCICSPPWDGIRCERLLFVPASRDGGFGSPHRHRQTTALSTWGGSVLHDTTGDGRFHMYASQMINHCGIDSWEPNSRIVHAASETVGGPYAFQSVVVPAFAHEPNAVRSPEGYWVLYFTMRHPPGGEVNCTATRSSYVGERTDDAGRVHSDRDARLRREEEGGDDDDDDDLPRPPPPRHTYMMYAKSPHGPWSEPELVLKASTASWDGRTVLIDTNLAVVILPSGEVVGLYRKCVNAPPGTVCERECCTYPRLLRATNWQDPDTYRTYDDEPIFADLEPFGVEDPMLWLDRRDSSSGGVVLHAILHDEQGPDRRTARGRHAFSDDGGASWVYGREDAYNGTVLWRERGGGGGKGRTTTDLFRRERPHMILSFARDGAAAANGGGGGGDKLLALSNGIQEVRESDRSWTMVQLLRQQREETHVTELKKE